MRRVKDTDDPRRCRSRAADGGQCWNEAVEKGRFCPVHGGRVRKYEEMNNYLTEQFKHRLKLEGGETDEIKLLKENLMSLNAMLAARTQLIIDEQTLILHSGIISELLMKAEKVTVSLNRLSLASGALLAKPALEIWCAQIIDAVSGMVQDKYDGWEDDLIEFSKTVAGIMILMKNVEEKK